MKKLHVFDSLKFVRAMFVAVVAIFAFAPAHADTTAIQSVIAYGKTEQSATPTPTSPVPIMTNNGSIKVFADNKWTDVNASVGYIIKDGSIQQNSNYIVSVPILLKAGDYSISYYTPDTGSRPFTIWESNAQGDLVGNSSVFNIARPDVGTNTGTFTIDRDMYVRVSWRVNFTDIVVAPTSAIIYTDGTVETLRDSAGHKATAEMLLSVGDYKDEQNITTGAITRKVGVKVLDGSENWIYRSDYNVFSWPGIGMMASGRPTSTHFPYRPYTTTGKYGVGYIYYTELFIKNTDYATLAEFKAYLAEQYANGTPVIVVYPLATETTESVTAQSLTTAPVRQTLGSIMNMPIVTTLTDGTVIGDLIRVATTKYNEESFEDVQGALTGVFNAVDTVVTQTMTQAQAIDTIATSKQTRPDEGCTAKYCLLVEDENGTPHWYPIAGANGVAHALPAGYTELQYIESTGTQYIDTGLKGTQDTKVVLDFQLSGYNDKGYILGSRTSQNTNAFIIGSNDAKFSGDDASFPFAQFDSVTPTNVQQVSKFDLNRHVYELSSGGFYIDGVLYITYSNPTNFSTPENITLFGRYSAGNFAYGIFRAYGLKLYNGNNLVRDLIPARNSSGVVGMYDLADSNPETAFHTNAGTGTFTAGPDM